MLTVLTRRLLLACVAAIPLASGWPELAAPEDEPIWDFEFDMIRHWWTDEAFVSAFARGSVRDETLSYQNRQEQDDWGSWMFSWPKRALVEQMGYRAYCDWMIADEFEEGRVGTVTVRLSGQETEVTS